jgi:hypothetical protein
MSNKLIQALGFVKEHFWEEEEEEEEVKLFP